MSFWDTINWDLLILGIACVINFFIASSNYYKLRRVRGKQHSQKRLIRELKDDVRTLYESSSSLGNRLQSVEHNIKVLREQQEQLTLKEPSQQTYRNAIQAINKGESINKIVENCGLSRGEVELLSLLQKINSSNAEKQST